MRSVMDDASSRQKEILKLEESISELNDLYNDMAILLQQQVDLFSYFHNCSTRSIYIYIN